MSAPFKGPHPWPCPHPCRLEGAVLGTGVKLHGLALSSGFCSWSSCPTPRPGSALPRRSSSRWALASAASSPLPATTSPATTASDTPSSCPSSTAPPPYSPASSLSPSTASRRPLTMRAVSTSKSPLFHWFSTASCSGAGEGGGK